MTDRDRLIELIKNCIEENIGVNDPNVSFEVDYENITDYLLANGVIVPPCKVGDKIYWVIDNITDRNIKEFCIAYDEETDFGVCEFTVYGFMKREDNNLRIYIEEIDYYTVFFLYEKDIGKTVFLTKEEAEEKLKELGK